MEFFLESDCAEGVTWDSDITITGDCTYTYTKEVLYSSRMSKGYLFTVIFTKANGIIVIA